MFEFIFFIESVTSNESERVTVKTFSDVQSKLLDCQGFWRELLSASVVPTRRREVAIAGDALGPDRRLRTALMQTGPGQDQINIGGI